MPDTFAHLGVQAFVSRGLLKDADIKWIATGCIIPDIPWITQRILLALHVPVDPYTLRIYFIVQASLLFCLLLSAIIALLTLDSRRIFQLLALNSFMHLLLDALQIKWANGVHFFAPFCWQVTNFGLIWPEHPVSIMLTLLGVLALVYFGTRDWDQKIVLASPGGKHTAALLLLAAYLILPVLLSYGPRQEDNHFAATLHAVEQRPGRYVELDRLPYRSRDKSLLLPGGERIKLEGKTAQQNGIVSVQGHFIDAVTIHASALHVHSPLRDISSKTALAGILLLWFLAFVRKRITFPKAPVR